MIFLRYPASTPVGLPSSLLLGRPGPPGPPGPPGAGGGSASLTFSGTNQSGGTLAAGTAVAVHSSGVGVVKAKATASGYPAVGLATGSVAASGTGSYQTDGPMTLADWSGFLDTGSPTLTPKGLYFLSITDGKLSMAVPSAGGQYVQPIGYAVNSSTLEIEISPPILL